MQRIDYWVGIPLCALLSALNSIVSFIRPHPPIQSSPKKLLFIELSEMGSAILAYPTLQRARSLFPDAENHFLIFRRNVESVELLGALRQNHIHVIEDNTLFQFLLSAVKTVWRLRTLRFDATIDMELFSRCTALISFLIGAPVKVGFHKYTEEGLYRGNFLTHRVSYNPHFHIAQNFASLLEATRETPSEEPLVKTAIEHSAVELPLVSVELEKLQARSHLEGAFPQFSTSTRLVLLNPDPGILALRGWPIESYCSLADKLLSADPCLIVGVIGLSRSSRFYSLISQHSSSPERIINLCGATTSMRELLGFFALSSVLVTNDSGPAHFAPLVGLRSVVLFGPETPKRYAPLGTLHTSLFANFACSPCFSAQNHRRSVCTNNRCLQAISVDEVFVATQRALSTATRLLST